MFFIYFHFLTGSPRDWLEASGQSRELMNTLSGKAKEVRMSGSLKKHPIVTGILTAAFCIIFIALAVFLIKRSNKETVTYISEDVSVTKVDLKQSVTAAGKIVTADSEKIYFDTDKVFSGMCVEESEKVSKGQHLIKYSDGTYEDAPDDGFVVSVNAPATGSYGGTSNYLNFSYAEKLTVDITVPEGEVNEISEGDTVEIVVNADTSKVYTGKIIKKKAMSTTQMGSGNSNSSSRFGSSADIAYYTVSVEFENDGAILRGMSAICTITISEKKGVTAVPIESVRFDDEGKAYVAVVDGEETKQVFVTTGVSDADYVEITSGLEGDETVRIERKG